MAPNTDRPQAVEPTTTDAREYEPPILVHYGDLADMTKIIDAEQFSKPG